MKNREFIHFGKIDSTQEYAKKIAKKSPSGTVVVAEKQTEGRGRFERKWYSQKGGIFFSVILKPQIEPQKIPILTYKMALAVMDTIRKLLSQEPGWSKRYDAALKWPNDVVIVTRNEGRRKRGEQKETRYKKIAGILTESTINKNKVDWVVIGVGININNKIPVSLKNTAVSLCEIISRKNIPLGGILDNIMEIFIKYYNVFPESLTLEKYKKNSIYFSGRVKKIVIDCNGTGYTGQVSGITGDGGLEVMLSEGIKKIFYAGDVVLD